MRPSEISWRMVARVLPLPKHAVTCPAPDGSCGSRKARGERALRRFVHLFGRVAAMRMDHNRAIGPITCPRKCGRALYVRRFPNEFAKATFSLSMAGRLISQKQKIFRRHWAILGLAARP